MKQLPRKCDFCGNKYRPKNNRQRFCDAKCRRNAWYHRNKRKKEWKTGRKTFRQRTGRQPSNVVEWAIHVWEYIYVDLYVLARDKEVLRKGMCEMLQSVYHIHTGEWKRPHKFLPDQIRNWATGGTQLKRLDELHKIANETEDREILNKFGPGEE